MTSRTHLGLRPKNSPSLIVLQQKKSMENVLHTLQYKPPISPAFYDSDNKENTTQAPQDRIETTSSEAQTNISTIVPPPICTSEDLTAAEPTLNYYKNLIDILEKEAEEERVESVLADIDEDESISELNDTKYALDLLKQVAEEIDAEEVIPTTTIDA